MSISIQTKCLHLEDNDKEEGPCHFGAVSFPIYQTATFAHSGAGESTGFDYSRLQNPTREHLEKIVCNLESGIDALALSSGMAAISLVFELFSPGDEIIAESDLYGGSIRLFDNVSKKNGVKIISKEISRTSAGELEKSITSSTRAIYIETPTNPMMNITDIKALAEITKKHNLLLIVDNTFMSPYFQNPLLLGADIVIHSGTKYLSGHNDTLSGFVVTNRGDIKEKLRFLIKTTGAGLSPFDSWLTLRGIKTLAVRMEKAQENAIKIVEYLKKNPHIRKVIYPGLKEHPGYEIQKKQARGTGCMITFQTDSKEKTLSILNKVRLIQFAESLGGVESLITYPVTQTHADVPEVIRLKNGITDTTLRLSVGIEDADDLINDLSQALQAD